MQRAEPARGLPHAHGALRPRRGRHGGLCRDRHRVGLGEIGFSDHVPMYWLPEERRDPTGAMAMEELEAYVSDVLRLRERYPEISHPGWGWKADFIPGHEEELVRLLEPYPWDYVIGSVHFLDDWNFDHPDLVHRYAEWDIDVLYDRFFALERAAAESGLFDILAHIDLIKKFGHRPRRPERGLRGPGRCHRPVRRRDRAVHRRAAQARGRVLPRPGPAESLLRPRDPGGHLVGRPRPGGGRLGVCRGAGAGPGGRVHPHRPVCRSAAPDGAPS